MFVFNFYTDKRSIGIRTTRNPSNYANSNKISIQQKHEWNNFKTETTEIALWPPLENQCAGQ